MVEISPAHDGYTALGSLDTSNWLPHRRILVYLHNPHNKPYRITQAW